MPKVIQINPVVKNGSTGRITEQIGLRAIERGWDSYIAYSGRPQNTSASKLIQVGDYFANLRHAINTRLFDRHGLSSVNSSKKFVNQLDIVKPDLLHLHNIHGYFLNYEILFDYIFDKNIPVIWTFHDFWPITGHCTYFLDVKCEKWKSQCYKCPKLGLYPKSIWLDNSENNYQRKKKCFSRIENLTIVPVSNWAAGIVKKSFLQDKDIKVIYNGIDTEIFKPRQSAFMLRLKLGLEGKFVIMAMATTWGKRKGWFDYIELAKILPPDVKIVLVGVTEKEIRELPPIILGVKRTESIGELAELYSLADIIMNLSYQETFGLTTVEGFACGTPGIVYNNTASPELMNPYVGELVETGNLQEVISAIELIRCKGKDAYSSHCRSRAVSNFSSTDRFNDYLDLYEQKIK